MSMCLCPEHIIAFKKKMQVENNSFLFTRFESIPNRITSKFSITLNGAGKDQSMGFALIIAMTLRLLGTK